MGSSASRTAMNLSDPRFTDADEAREYLEAQRWPNGPECPHCGNFDQTKIKGLKGKAHRPGVYQCNECREQFTVTVGTVMERSNIPLNKWLLAITCCGQQERHVAPINCTACSASPTSPHGSCAIASARP